LKIEVEIDGCARLTRRSGAIQGAGESLDLKYPNVIPDVVAYGHMSVEDDRVR
jgi:hypothetical protein